MRPFLITGAPGLGDDEVSDAARAMLGAATAAPTAHAPRSIADRRLKVGSVSMAFLRFDRSASG
jgi:hypothetical protein